jgi:hypothetical protein
MYNKEKAMKERSKKEKQTVWQERKKQGKLEPLHRPKEN